MQLFANQTCFSYLLPKGKSGFRLICPGQTDPVEVDDYLSCNLAKVPAHAVVTRPERRKEVISILNNQQVSNAIFRMHKE